jgi:uncharacterized protein
MDTYDLVISQASRTLGQVHRWLDKAQALADQKKFDVNVLLSCRLAPDQFALARQIQTLCDQAKGIAARLAGVDPPKYEDNETTVAELRARVDKTLAYLKTFKPEQFQGAEDRVITMPFAATMGLKGYDFLLGMALPNFFFHAATVYAILRHNGVDVGKMDFLGELPFLKL